LETEARVWRLLLGPFAIEDRRRDPSGPYVTTGSVHLPPPQGGIRRELFTVSGVRVTFDGESWECGCSHGEPGAPCTHVEQAQRFRQLRCNRQEARPIQLALEGLQIPARLEAVERPSTEVKVPPPAFVHIPHAITRSTAVMATLFAGALFSAFAYFTTKPPPIIVTAAVASPYSPALAHEAPPEPPTLPAVKLPNPFDASEIFEFPPGTSDQEARDTAASLLLERARHRLATAADHDHSM
jgi:hypothetical protein